MSSLDLIEDFHKIDWSAKLLKKMSEDDDSRDIELIAGVDKQKFAVHRLVMMSASNYFHALLGPNFKEGKDKEVIIADVDGATLKSIIDYCYTGNITINNENIMSIISVASRMEMVEIERECEHHWMRNLAFHNVVETFMSADKYSLTVLRKKSINLMCVSFDNVTASQLKKLDFQHFVELLKCNEIFGPEEDVCRKLIQWVDHDKKNRSKNAAALLKLVKLKCIPIQFLLDVVEDFCKEHNSLETLLAEYRERLRGDRDDIALARSQSITILWESCYLATCELDDGLIVHVDKYIPSANRWEPYQKMRFSSERKHFEVVNRYNDIYIMGGMVAGDYVRSIDYFDGDSLEYTSNKYSMTTSRGLFTPVVLDGSIYILGGWNGISALNACESLNVHFGRGTKTALEPMLQARYKYGAAVLRGSIYVAGGKSDIDKNLSSVECYDPETDNWTQIAEMNHPRDDFALVAMTDCLYALGYDRTVERYDLKSNSWTVIGLFDGSEKISRAVGVCTEIYVLMGKREFGKVKPNLECSLVPLRSTPHACDSAFSLLLY